MLFPSILEEQRAPDTIYVTYDEHSPFVGNIWCCYIHSTTSYITIVNRLHLIYGTAAKVIEYGWLHVLSVTLLSAFFPWPNSVSRWYCSTDVLLCTRKYTWKSFIGVKFRQKWSVDPLQLSPQTTRKKYFVKIYYWIILIYSRTLPSLLYLICQKILLDHSNLL